MNILAYFSVNCFFAYVKLDIDIYIYVHAINVYFMFKLTYFSQTERYVSQKNI